MTAMRQERPDLKTRGPALLTNSGFGGTGAETPVRIRNRFIRAVRQVMQFGATFGASVAVGGDRAILEKGRRESGACTTRASAAAHEQRACGREGAKEEEVKAAMLGSSLCPLCTCGGHALRPRA